MLHSGRFARGMRLVLAPVVLLTAAGCLLSTRENEDPLGGDEGSVYVAPGTLGQALGNIKRALEVEDMNNYGRSFDTNSFEMLLDPADESEIGFNEFEEWSAGEEQQRMQGILSATTAALVVTWTPADSLNGETTNVRYYRDVSYRLAFSDIAPVRSVTYSGLADVWFEDDGTGQWYITRWVDKRDGSANRTWGWLRARSQVEFQ